MNVSESQLHPNPQLVLWLWNKKYIEKNSCFSFTCESEGCCCFCFFILEAFLCYICRKPLYILKERNKSNALTNERKKSSVCGCCSPLISPSNGLIQPVWKHWTGYMSWLLHSGICAIHWSVPPGWGDVLLKLLARRTKNTPGTSVFRTALFHSFLLTCVKFPMQAAAVAGTGKILDLCVGFWPRNLSGHKTHCEKSLIIKKNAMLSPRFLKRMYQNLEEWHRLLR